EMLGIPAVLTNDANAAAVGEMTYGAARGMKDFIMITLGTGVGSGIVVNGQVVYGHDGFAGELGHVIVRHDGRRCGCGRNGCLEAYCSATGLVRTVQGLLIARDDESLLRRLSSEEITSKEVYEAVLEGDLIAQEAFSFYFLFFVFRIVSCHYCSSGVHNTKNSIRAANINTYYIRFLHT
ncbi:hypothetical protein EZS27_033357, partial [termite gut metagenome]